MRAFGYFCPKNIKKACSILKQNGKDAAVLAGGTDLIVDLKRRMREVSCVVDINGISPLRRFTRDSQGTFVIGSLTTLQTLSEEPMFREGVPLLSTAASKIGSWQVRNLATLGGNVCRASPSGDTLSPLLCLNASLKLTGLGGTRIVAIDDFFKGPGRSAISSEEILTEIVIPQVPHRSVGIFRKLSQRRAMDLAVVSIAVLAVLDPGREFLEDIRIGLGAVAPVPFRAKKTEELLRGKRIDETILGEAGDLAASEADPIGDVRASETYRQEMIKKLLQAAIREITSGRISSQ